VYVNFIFFQNGATNFIVSNFLLVSSICSFFQHSPRGQIFGIQPMLSATFLLRFDRPALWFRGRSKCTSSFRSDCSY